MEKENKNNEVSKYSFFNSFSETMNKLSDEDCGKLVKAINKYVFEGEEPELTGVLDIVFPTIKAVLKNDKTNRMNGVNGGRPKNGTGLKKENNPPFEKKITPLSQKNNPVYEKVKTNENENENVNENDECESRTKNENVNVKENACEKQKSTHEIFIDYEFCKKTFDEGIGKNVFSFTNFNDFWVYWKDKGVLKEKLHNLMIRWDIRWNEENKKQPPILNKPNWQKTEAEKIAEFNKLQVL